MVFKRFMRGILFLAGLTQSMTILASNTQTLLPPKYLSVPKWQACVGMMSQGNAQFICLPEKKPKNCAVKSWKALLQLEELQYCT